MFDTRIWDIHTPHGWTLYRRFVGGHKQCAGVFFRNLKSERKLKIRPKIFAKKCFFAHDGSSEIWNIFLLNLSTLFHFLYICTHQQHDGSSTTPGMQKLKDSSHRNDPFTLCKRPIMCVCPPLTSSLASSIQA